MPVKGSHTRIKPLALASGHGRYIAVIPEWALLSEGEWPLHKNRYKFVTVSLLKRFRNGRFNSETATWIQKRFKLPAGTSRKLRKCFNITSHNP
jgi:hypothetical protein